MAPAISRCCGPKPRSPKERNNEMKTLALTSCLNPWRKFVLALLCCSCAELAYAAQPFVFGRADFPTGNLPFAMVTADFNGDGNPDMAVVNWEDNTVSVFFGKPDGTFVKNADYVVGVHPDAIAIGDFNGDGRPDLAVTNQNCNHTCGAGSMSVLLNRGDGTFQPAVSYGTDTDPVSVIIGDFTGNGRLDLAVASAITTVQPVAGTVSIFLNNGDGTFYLNGKYAAGYGVGQLAAVKLAGTANPSLAVTDFVSFNGVNAVSILRNRGDGSFALPIFYLTGKAPSWVASADFNRDGIADLAVVNEADSTVSILLGRSDGTFANKVDYPVAFGPHQLVAGDFNGDQIVDLAVGAGTTSNGGGAVSILMGKGDGTFQPALSYGTGNNPWSLVAADVNHDGKLDLAFTNGDVNRVSVLLGNGDGTFPSYANYSSGRDVVAIAVADFNGDGSADLAMVNQADNTVSILFGSPSGKFTGRQIYDVGHSPSSAAVADLSGDGDLDVVVTNGGDNSISVLLNHGNGVFGPISTYSVGSNPGGIVIADFNGDHKPDLAVTNTNDGTVSILLNRGDGTFLEAGTYGTGQGPASIVAADFNGDGKPDLAIADSLEPGNGLGSGLVSVLLNNGDGTFGSRTDYSTGQFPASVVAGDFNGSGKMDLAVAGNLDIYGNVSILMGNGDGSFQRRSVYDEGFGISSLVAADFNADGKLDLAVVSTINNTFFIMKGMGDGSFQVQGTYGVANGPMAIATGMFAKRMSPGGGADLVVSNLGISAVSVFLNGPPY
jgi:hypothetical protein